MVNDERRKRIAEMLQEIAEVEFELHKLKVALAQFVSKLDDLEKPKVG